MPQVNRPCRHAWSVFITLSAHTDTDACPVAPRQLVCTRCNRAGSNASPMAAAESLVRSAASAYWVRSCRPPSGHRQGSRQRRQGSASEPSIASDPSVVQSWVAAARLRPCRGVVEVHILQTDTVASGTDLVRRCSEWQSAWPYAKTVFPARLLAFPAAAKWLRNQVRGKNACVGVRNEQELALVISAGINPA